MPKPWRSCLLLSGVIAALAPLQGVAQQHDFDFELGAWKTHLSRLLHPLTGSTTWVDYDGTTRVRPVWDGRANLLELEADGPSGHIEALSLRDGHTDLSATPTAAQC